MRQITAFLVLLLCLPLYGQDITLSKVEKVIVEKVNPVLPGEVLKAGNFPLQAVAPGSGFGYSWDVPAGFQVKRKANKLDILAAPKGVHEIGVEYSTVDFENKKIDTHYLSLTFTVGDGPTPVPPGPNPPDPPGPTPIPAPIAVNGLAVLMVYETSDKPLPVGQFNVIYGKQVRDYLDAKCAADPVAPNGKAYRIWDKDVKTENAGKVWADAMARPRTAVPWLVISNGKTGYEGPLPNGPDEAITLMKKFEN